jgi:hypothetical protein
MNAVIQHLRLPFSILLMPTFFFALTFVSSVDVVNLGLIFFLMHGLVFPSSNAYNSTQDNDIGSIGLIEKPLPVPAYLYKVTLALDAIALLLAYYINRLYSFRKVRIKRFAFLSYFLVSGCQGAFTFMIFYLACHSSGDVPYKVIHFFNTNTLLLSALITSFYIGAIYPLTQIYQHAQDEADGVHTISMALGIKGTFIWSGICFSLGTAILSWLLESLLKVDLIFIFLLCTLPCIAFFLYWTFSSYKDVRNANYSNMLKMNIVSCMSLLIYFIIFYLKF